MKTLIFALPLLLFIGCVDKSKVITGLEGKPMPSFDLLLEDSTTNLNTKDIPFGKPIVLFAFRPDCPFCQAEIKEITKNISELKDIRIYLLTSAKFSDAKHFYNSYNLEKYKQICVGIDSLNKFVDYYNCPGVPYLAVFDPQKKLKQAILGKTSIGYIKNIAFE